MTHRAHTVGMKLLIVFVWGLLVSTTAWAQQAPSGIVGVARDESGGVLPGVTVEAASPALIEKVRTAVTDGDGRFNITDLRPGAYVITFSLEGFNTFKREGITLTAGFTATINADMKVGALAETITVTGAAPLVDTSNVRQQKVVSAELLEALPTGSKAIQNLVTLTPGMTGTADVGGSSGLYRSNGPRAATFHGKTGVRVLYDGMNILAAGGTGSSNGYLPNPQFAEESTVETGGISAESSGAGILINQIPKSGGNTFTSTNTILYTTNGLQSNNLSDTVKSQGLQTTNEVLRLYDANLTLGGPIRKDKLWFFAAARAAGNKNTVAGIYFNATPHTPFYNPDLSRPAYRQEWIKSAGGRFTWQASQKNKFSGIADVQGFYNRGRGEFSDPTAATSAYNLAPVGLYQVTWNSVRSSKLLFEAGFSYAPNRWPYPSPGDRFMQVDPTDISILENSTGFRYNGKQFYTNQIDQFRYSERASVSYVTGSHAVKVGVQIEQGINNQDQVVHGDVNYIFLNGVPNQVTQWATPFLQKNRAREVAVYGQDQWTLNRLTLNAGLRLDWFVGRVPAQNLPAGQFVPARNFDAVENVPNWKDVSPRLGASYDLFGNGRTAVKVSVGRYLEQLGAGIASDNNPVVRSVLSANRTWNDVNGNYVPDCNLSTFTQNGECGPIGNTNFGQNNPNASRYDDALLTGWGKRNYAWDFGTEVQHQLREGLSTTFGYYRNWSSNFRVTDNASVTPSSFQPFCVTAPMDPRLPNGGGYEVCGLYDVVPAQFGLTNNVVTNADQFFDADSDVTCSVAGSISGVASRGNGITCGKSDFFNVSVNSRLARGITIGGGVDTGRTVVDTCFVVDSPQALLNCRVVTPFSAQTQIKVYGNYPLPYGVSVSATYQNLSGASFEANYNAPNSVVASSLGRNLSACGTRNPCTATVLVPLVAPMTSFLDRRSQLDLRFTKSVKLGRMKVQGNLDLYNAFNAGTVLSVNSTYGSAWQRPVSDNAIGGVDPILPGRLIQVGGSVSF